MHRLACVLGLTFAVSACAGGGSHAGDGSVDAIIEVSIEWPDGCPPATAIEGIDLGIVRQAIRNERKLGFLYRDAGGAASQRVVWPFALGFFDQVRMVVAWCELRQAIRHFRTDRIVALTVTGERYVRRRADLLKDWRREQGVRG